jgi:leucyl aminopeptidase
MNIALQNKNDITFPSDVLILPLFEGREIHPYSDVNNAFDGLLLKIATSGEFHGRHNQMTLVHSQKKITPQRVLMTGLGKKGELSREKLRQAGGKTASFLKNLGIKHVSLSTRSIAQGKVIPTDFLEGFLLSHYHFQRYQKDNDRKTLQNFTILSKKKFQEQIRYTKAAVHATHFTRDLVNTPSNDMTPSALLQAARSLKNVSVRVIEKNQAEKLGMGAYLSVTRGSQEPAKFIIASYKKKNVQPIVLIGKSVTFDSGGLSLKQREDMVKMKYDMAGGAAVLGIMKAASELNMSLNLIGILPATENLPGGNASKPGDVIQTIDGKTVEIISTDAEGRLSLADALAYAKRYKPQAIIDIATLTGACLIALGNEAIAMMGNDRALLTEVEKASEETAEKVWQMPLFEEYKDYNKSDIAMLKNFSGRAGSLVASGCFLREFVDDIPWVHLDIAGTAWTDKNRPYIPQGATGIGVRLLLSFLRFSEKKR